MTDRITRQDFAHMIAAAASKIREQHARLSQLDCVAGDGDHGASMLRTMDRLEQAFAKDANLKSCFCDAGWNVMGADGGASTSLLGAFFLGIGEGASAAESWNCSDLADAFRAGLRAVEIQTKARPGDKTMMDALAPAVQAMSNSAANGKDIDESVAQAARAASGGADATKDMIAKYGRARLLGDKTLGSQDAGAASVALIFDGFARALTTHTGERNA